MVINGNTIEGLKMIKERYFFGMFSGSQDMDLDTETEEYMMRDAVIEIVRELEQNRPTLFDSVEGGDQRGGNRTSIEIVRELEQNRSTLFDSVEGGDQRGGNHTSPQKRTYSSNRKRGGD